LNHIAPDLDNISLFQPPNPTIPSSIVVDNGSVLPVTLVGDTVLPGLFYLNNVLVTPDIIKNLLFVHQFTTDNWCSMEFDPFDLSVKDLAIRNVTTRCNSSGSLYTIQLPVMHTPHASTFYALTIAATTMSLWHRRLGHPDTDAFRSFLLLV
jgi:hypothetical protein